MKDSTKILIGVTVFTSALAFVLFFSKKRYKKEKDKQLEMIAEEGYETAGDILFPSSYKLSSYNPSLN